MSDVNWNRIKEILIANIIMGNFKPTKEQEQLMELLGLEIMDVVPKRKAELKKQQTDNKTSTP